MISTILLKKDLIIKIIDLFILSTADKPNSQYYFDNKKSYKL